MTEESTAGSVRLTDGLGPVGKKMSAEEYHRTDGKAGAFLWWSDIPNGAFLYTEEQVEARVAAERERWRQALTDAMEVGGHLMSSRAYERARRLRDEA